RRGGRRRAGLLPSRTWSDCRLCDGWRRHPAGDGNPRCDGNSRSHRQPHRRPAPGLAEPKGASVMTTSIPTPAPPRRGLFARILGNPLGASSIAYLVVLLLIAV